MSEELHIDILNRGAKSWNEWRQAHPGVTPQLAGCDLSDLQLEEVDLSDGDLTKADLFGANLKSANLKMVQMSEADVSDTNLEAAELYKADLTNAFLTKANLRGAYLVEAKLSSADLRGAKMDGADMTKVLLKNADLSNASLREANLNKGKLDGANLRNADMSHASLIDMTYGTFRSMRGHFHGIRGLDSCFGNALFVRDAQDQDYLDTLEHSLHEEGPTIKGCLKRAMFSLWGRIDYGRSLSKPVLYALGLAGLYGIVYLLDMLLGWGLTDFSNSARSWFTPFYYSFVTYTTLGFGDITPKHWLGEIIIVSEVIFGYVTLGLLLSILANKVARRS